MGGEQPYPPDSHHSARFVCKNSGVLFENQLLQIGVKSEFRQNLGVSWWPGGWGRRVTGRVGDGQHLLAGLVAGMASEELGWTPPPPAAGRMYLFYGNKTSVQFQSFSPTVVHPGDLQTHILCSWPRQCPIPPLEAPGKQTFGSIPVEPSL